MSTLYVGIDVSSKTNVVHMMFHDGAKCDRFSIANSRHGSAQLVNKIVTTLSKHDLNSVQIGLEATSVYGDGLVYFLREDAILARFDCKVYILNPKQVR